MPSRHAVECNDHFRPLGMVHFVPPPISLMVELDEHTEIIPPDIFQHMVIRSMHREEKGKVWIEAPR